jgi:hypothetical protein
VQGTNSFFNSINPVSVLSNFPLTLPGDIAPTRSCHHPTPPTYESHSVQSPDAHASGSVRCYRSIIVASDLKFVLKEESEVARFEKNAYPWNMFEVFLNIGLGQLFLFRPCWLFVDSMDFSGYSKRIQMDYSV